MIQRRIDATGRDITDMPGLWSESDMLEVLIQLPAHLYEKLEDAAELIGDAKIGAGEAASLAVANAFRMAAEHGRSLDEVGPTNH